MKCFSILYQYSHGMAYGFKLLVLFCFISFLYGVGIFLFTRGFLLNRLVINDLSDCSEAPEVILLSSDQELSNARKSEGCWMKKTHEKVVILIIDALRYDFALYNSNLDDDNALPYQNKLKVIHEVLASSPQHGALFKFVADPPTTTMQRLKALTTGKLFFAPDSCSVPKSNRYDVYSFSTLTTSKNVTNLQFLLTCWVQLFKGGITLSIRLTL